MQEGKLLLSPEEACELIGVGKSNIFKLLQSGEIHLIKVGRLRKIPRQALSTWIERKLSGNLAIDQ